MQDHRQKIIPCKVERYMSKFKKEYVIPIKTDEAKQKIRDWVGTHNGMSILRSDWVYDLEGISVESHDTYVLSITNPKTEMLFILSFPEAIEKEQFLRESAQDWDDNWTTIIKT